MLLRDRAHDRGVELGPYPLEALARDASLLASETARPATAPAVDPEPADSALARVARRYAQIFIDSDTPADWPRAPVPADLIRRTQEIKGAADYLDASHVGIARIPESCLLYTSDAADES